MRPKTEVCKQAENGRHEWRLIQSGYTWLSRQTIYCIHCRAVSSSEEPS